MHVPHWLPQGHHRAGPGTRPLKTMRLKCLLALPWDRQGEAISGKSRQFLFLGLFIFFVQLQDTGFIPVIVHLQPGLEPGAQNSTVFPSVL